MTTQSLGNLVPTVLKFRESFIISLVLFFLMVIKLQCMCKSISLIQQDQRTYNLPTAEEIAVIILEEGVYHALDNKDVVLQARGG